MNLGVFKGFIMADDAPTPEQMVPSLLHAVMWACMFGGVDAVIAAKPWPIWAGAFALSLISHIVGIKWPLIKPAIGPRFASFVERIASDRRYRRAIYSLVAVAIAVTVGVRLYRHYYPPIHQATTDTSPTVASSTDSYGPLQPLTPLESLTVSPIKLIFKDQTIGRTSSPQTVTVVNRATAPRIITGIKITGGTFSQTNDCGSELMVGDSCNVEVTFAPTAPGLTHGSLDISCIDPLFSSIHLTATVDFSGSGKASIRSAAVPNKTLNQIPQVAETTSHKQIRDQLSEFITQGLDIKGGCERLDTDEQRLNLEAGEWGKRVNVYLDSVDHSYSARFRASQGLTYSVGVSSQVKNSVWNFINLRIQTLTQILQELKD